MKIDWDGRTWEFDSDNITFRQGEQIYRYYQLTIDDFNSGMDKMDQRCYHVAYWLMLQQSGRKDVGLANCGDVQVVPFMLAFTEARVAEAERLKAEAEAEVAAQAAEAAAQAEPPGPTSLPPGDQAWSGHGYPTATTQQAAEPQYLPVSTGYSPSP